MNTDLVVSPVDETVDRNSDGLKHIVCCEDRQSTMCGIKLKSASETEPMKNLPVNACLVCVDIWYKSNECPLLPSCILNRQR